MVFGKELVVCKSSWILEARFSKEMIRRPSFFFKSAHPDNTEAPNI